MIQSRGRREFLPQAGFSLVELLVTVIILAEILVGLLIVFDSSSRLARAQTHVAELQQSLRVGQGELTRFARMTGLGGLPIMPLTAEARAYYGTFPEAGPAVSVFNNVPDKTTIVELLGGPDGADDLILTGSDVLVLRGVFSTPMFYLDPPLDIDLMADGDGNPCNNGLLVDGDKLFGRVTLPARARISGRSYWDYPQEIDELAQRLTAAKTDGEPLAMMLRDTLNPNAYVVAAFDHANTLAGDLVPATCPNIDTHVDLPAEHVPECIRFCVELDPAENPGDGPGQAYTELTGGTNLQTGAGIPLLVDAAPDPDFQVFLPKSIGSIGLVEEYRLFVRAEWEVPGKEDTRLTPVLARAEFLPGTDTQIDRIDVADNVLDLQIAVGADADPVSSAGYGDILDNGSELDEVLFNSTDDEDSSGNLEPAQGTDVSVPWSDPGLEFHFLRLNTLVQARLPDLSHRSPKIIAIEDFNRGETFEVNEVGHSFNEDLRYQRRWLQTVIELRNLQ